MTQGGKRSHSLPQLPRGYLPRGLPRAFKDHGGQRGRAYTFALNNFLALYPKFPRPQGDRVLAMYGAAESELWVVENSDNPDPKVVRALRQQTLNMYDRCTSLARAAERAPRSVASTIKDVEER